jgi:hypothetical protein
MDYTTDRYAVYVGPNGRLYATFATLEAARAYVASCAAVQVAAVIWDRTAREWLDRPQWARGWGMAQLAHE